MRVPVLFAAVAAAGLAVAAAPMASAAGGQEPGGTAGPQRCAWRVVPSPVRGALFGVTALSGSDAWVVGVRVNKRTLAEHWNGAAWTAVPSPSPGPAGARTDDELLSVVAVTKTDIWAFGDSVSVVPPLGQLPSTILIEHWNGSKWKVVPSPDPGTGNDVLDAAAALSASDVWAVGSRQQGTGPVRALIEHWNGVRWRIVASPHLGTAKTSSSLNGIAFGSPRQAWAVGGDSLAGGRVLALRWNGARWSVSKAANPGGGGRVLNGVTATSARYALAVGSDTGPSGHARTLAEQWTGSAWSVVPSASPSPGLGVVLSAVAARSRGYASAVGQLGFARGGVAEHWDGRTWTQVPVPVFTADNLLSGVAAVPKNGGFWAVGQVGLDALIEKNC